ncbi:MULTISPECIES: IS110 family transposase [Sphingobium]|jgi:transposase|uniref:IS110 family transposase n=1 Tax=Sphingobium TaxID=165695 RepID=UPI000C46837A|nr:MULTISPECIES: IS110 family transposase [Sphingobium]MBS87450.1 IS110 family transposase [Sphingobium sp.]QWT16201.1 IS110 family transposase [Sphingobium xenophagum]|tara:strand:- start:4082 stop:5023 length:942 start_codon:yes stop_codon:yes gene_type:complete
MSEPLPQTIGIDISKATLDCHAHPAGIDRQFANSAKGYKSLIAWPRQWEIERIAYEATGTYHRALEQALAHMPCVKLNPERARRFAQATGTLAKTDRIDAALLARMAATLQPPIRPARSAQQALLAELVNARDGLVRDRTALKNREKNLTVALLKRHCKQRLEQIARHLEALDAEIAAIIAADADLARRHQILTSIDGVGTLTANQLVATMPELGTLENKEAASLAGLAPVARQSGQWKGKSFIRGGRANVRQALYMPALVAARFNPDLKDKYQQLIAAGKPAKVAITAVMRKLVVTANALLKADRLWVKSLA